MNGYFPGDDGKRLSEQMLDSKNVRVEGEETIDRIACTIVAAKGPLGEMRQWIAPSRGCLPLKVTIHKGLGDIYYSGKTVAESPKEYRFDNQSLIAVALILENIELLKIGEAYVAIAGCAIETEHLSGKHDFVMTCTYKYSDVDLKPQFEGTDYFTPGLVKNAPVVNADKSTSEVQHRWDGSKVVTGEPGASTLSGWGIIRLASLAISVVALLGLCIMFYQRRAKRV